MSHKKSHNLSINCNHLVKLLLLSVYFVLMTVLTGKNVYASSTERVVEDSIYYEIGQAVERLNVQCDIPVTPGRNYRITVYYKAFSEISKQMFIYYDEVSEDECTPNVDSAATDRSGLLKETIAPDEEGSRTFELAAIEENLHLTVAGELELVGVLVEKYAAYEAGEKTTVYMLGDSQLRENSPKTGWAQRISEYFSDDILFENRAIGARSTGNYIRQGRLNAVLLDVKPGDYVLVDFGHNDAGGVAGRAVTLKDYKNYLINAYIKGIKERGAIPVIVTIGNRNDISSAYDKVIPTYPDYVNAAIEAAQETDSLYIDLNLLSREFLYDYYHVYGADAPSGVLYIDGTHYSSYGAYRFAGLVAKQLSEMNLSGISEFYTEPEKESLLPGVSSITSSKSEEKSTVFTLAEAKGADYYKLEGFVIKKDGTLEALYPSKYSFTPEISVANTIGKDYIVRVYTCNDAGLSEASGYYCTDPSVDIDKILNPHESVSEEVEEKTETTTATATVVDTNVTTANTEANDADTNNANAETNTNASIGTATIILIILIAVICSIIIIIFIAVKLKKRN